MNDREREMWVLNDEYLYHWFLTWHGGRFMRKFVRKHRDQLTHYINDRLGGKK